MEEIITDTVSKFDAPPGDPPMAYAIKTHKKFEIVSTVAYLIGVPRKYFEAEHQPLQEDIFDRLSQEKTARIIRNLCRLRTEIIDNFTKINTAMRYDLKTLTTLPEYITADGIRQLSEDGISIIRSQQLLFQYIIDINRLVSDRINNCKGLFPLWINWSYVREVFIMPDGFSADGTVAASDLYHRNRSCYPYSMYINWSPTKEGNILYNDEKFVKLLYGWHGERFAEYSKVSDVSDATKARVHTFLAESERCVLVVDCENSDPYKLCATLRNPDDDSLRSISKIMLFDDIHSSSAWSLLDTFVDIPVDHILIDRVKRNKSLVDIRLTTGVCQEHYKNDVDSFILASSDSDYWGLIEAIPAARFLVMVERAKCGPDMKRALADSGIGYCYIDDFYSGNSEDLKIIAVLREMRKHLEPLQFNIFDMLDSAYRTTRVSMSEAEKQQFYQKYIKPMHLEIAPDGTVRIEFRSK